MKPQVPAASFHDEPEDLMDVSQATTSIDNTSTNMQQHHHHNQQTMSDNSATAVFVAEYPQPYRPPPPSSLPPPPPTTMYETTSTTTTTTTHTMDILPPPTTTTTTTTKEPLPSSSLPIVEGEAYVPPPPPVTLMPNSHTVFYEDHDDGANNHNHHHQIHPYRDEDDADSMNNLHDDDGILHDPDDIVFDSPLGLDASPEDEPVLRHQERKSYDSSKHHRSSSKRRRRRHSTLWTMLCHARRPTNRRRSRLLLSIYAAAAILLIVIVVSVAVGLQAKSNQPRNVGPLVPAEEIDSYLRQLITNPAELDDEDLNSYTRKAYRWMMQHPFPENEFRMRVPDRVLQRYALACVYYATYQVTNEWILDNPTLVESTVTVTGSKKEAAANNQGGGGSNNNLLFPWKDSKGWLVYGNECDWSGVDCGKFGYVTGLDLGSNQLSGALPPQVAYLSPGLEVLNVEDNYNYNPNPYFLGQLTNLKYLYMKDSLFEHDGIPLSFAALTDLEELDVSYSLLDGPLHGNIFEEMPYLRYLEISGNRIDGPLPESLISSPRLKYFYADNVGLTGSLDFLEDMDAMVEIWLDRNPQLEGPLPDKLGNRLESLSVTRCNMTGPLPKSWSDHYRLKHVWLYQNWFTGQVPESWDELYRLETLELEVNRLTGTVPVCDVDSLHADCDLKCECCDCCGAVCITQNRIPA